MDDYLILDADPFIPTGVPATPEQVAQMIADGVVPADIVDQLAPEQRPGV